MEGRDELSGAVYREVFDGVDEGLVLLDPETGRIADANGTFVGMTGAERESIVGRRLVSVTDSDSHAAVAYAVTMLEWAAAGDPHSVEWTDLDASGEGMEFEVRFSPVTVGGTRLVLVVLRDVTAECALRRRKERLEEFASVVSHDLRGPLNVIEGELNRYRETRTDEHLDAVEAASAHLDRVVTDLLDLARDGRTIGETEPVSLEAVSRRAWALVDERGATLEVTADPTIRADPGRLTRALENLFRNSVEHGSTGPRSQTHEDSVEHGSTGSRIQSGDVVEPGSGPDRRLESAANESAGTAADGESAASLEVRVGALPDREGFFVADDGAGFPPETRERVFDPGFSTATDGTGLGLAIVHRIFEAHGWSVEAGESEAGGARFAVRGVTTGETAER